MITLVSSEQIKCNYEGEKLNFDRYNIEVKGQLSTKDYSIVVDFLKKEITGDCVAYGSWFDIELNDCLALLKSVFKTNKPIRDFKLIIN
ncbi:MAG TPA: hypothetical protein VK085_10705 [Pseudogracilibacillus sp.]|nr:hypothetical protein [Pseudogracilibacillus sp.]